MLVLISVIGAVSIAMFVYLVYVLLKGEEMQ